MSGAVAKPVAAARMPTQSGRSAVSRFNPKYLPLAATISLFVAMATIGSVLYSGFFSAQVFLNLLVDNAFLIVVAVGMTFVILSGGIDLSVGSVIALTTMVSAALVEHRGWSPAVVIPLVLAMGAAFGAFMGFLIERFRLQPFIVTLAGMFLARGLCYLISVDSISMTNEFYSEISQWRAVIVGCMAPPPDSAPGRALDNVL
jgi:simple sugar transport system permease protein